MLESWGPELTPGEQASAPYLEFGCEADAPLRDARHGLRYGPWAALGGLTGCGAQSSIVRSWRAPKLWLGRLFLNTS